MEPQPHNNCWTQYFTWHTSYNVSIIWYETTVLLTDIRCYSRIFGIKRECWVEIIKRKQNTMKWKKKILPERTTFLALCPNLLWKNKYESVCIYDYMTHRREVLLSFFKHEYNSNVSGGTSSRQKKNPDSIESDGADSPSNIELFL